MNWQDIRNFRAAHNLSRADLAKLLECPAHSVKLLEMDPKHAKSARTPAPRMVKVMQAYSAGIRFK